MKEIKKSKNDIKIETYIPIGRNRSNSQWIEILIHKVAELEEGALTEFEKQAILNKLTSLQEQIDLNDVDIEELKVQVAQIFGEISIIEDNVETVQTQSNNNSENIETLTQFILDNAEKRLNADLVPGTITEGVWTTVDWTLDDNSFTDITLNEDTSEFSVTDVIPKLDVVISGRADNTGASKIVSIRLWDVVNGVQYGKTQEQQINATGNVYFESVLNDLPIGTYRVEAISSVGGGTITFTDGLIKLLQYGNTTGATLSATFADGVNVEDVRWDSKVDVVDTFDSTASGITGQTRNDAQLSDSPATASINVAKISEITGANGTTSAALELKVKTDGTVSLVGKYKDGEGSFNSLAVVDDKDLISKDYLDIELSNKADVTYVDTGLAEKINRKWDISNPSNDITGFLDRAAEETINNATDSFLITEQVESITGAGSLTEINRRFSINVDGTFDYEVFGRRDGAVPSTPKNDWSMTPKKYVDEANSGKVDGITYSGGVNTTLSTGAGGFQVSSVSDDIIVASTNFDTRSFSGVDTTAKTIIGAINELKAEVSTLKSEIKMLKGGD